METRSAKRKRIAAQTLQNDVVVETHLDRISDLPDAVLHHILFLLPIKCVAQMSVLSKRWNFLWSTLPDLDFTTLGPFVIPSKNSKVSEFDKPRHALPRTKTDFINQVLSIRDKHSDIRVLNVRARLSFSSLNSLIRSAIKHNVKELDIAVATEVVTLDFFNLPRCIIFSESLRVLKLKSGFRLPPSSIMKNGFRSLHTLSLSLVIMYNEPSLSDLFSENSFPNLRKLHLDMCFGLKYLRVGCRGLEDLSLEKCFQLQGLDVCGGKLERMRVVRCFDAYNEKSWVRIDAPKLVELFWQYNSVTDETVFEGSKVLREASVGNFFVESNQDVGMGKLQSANSFLCGLSHARSLTLESQNIEILSNNYFIIHPFQNLESLELHTGFNKSVVKGLARLFEAPLYFTLDSQDHQRL